MLLFALLSVDNESHAFFSYLNSKYGELIGLGATDNS